MADLGGSAWYEAKHARAIASESNDMGTTLDGMVEILSKERRRRRKRWCSFWMRLLVDAGSYGLGLVGREKKGSKQPAESTRKRSTHARTQLGTSWCWFTIEYYCIILKIED